MTEVKRRQVPGKILIVRMLPWPWLHFENVILFKNNKRWQISFIRRGTCGTHRICMPKKNTLHYQATEMSWFNFFLGYRFQFFNLQNLKLIDSVFSTENKQRLLSNSSKCLLAVYCIIWRCLLIFIILWKFRRA